MTNISLHNSSPKEFLTALETLIDKAIEQDHGPEAVLEVLKEQGTERQNELKAIVFHLYKQKILTQTSKD